MGIPRQYTKKIDFDEHKHWLENSTESFQRQLCIIWGRYIKWKDPNKIKSKEERKEMKKVFIEGIVVGMLDLS